MKYWKPLNWDFAVKAGKLEMDVIRRVAIFSQRVLRNVAKNMVLQVYHHEVAGHELET